MKLQLDTVNKTIKIEEKVNISELMQMIKQILPNDTWKDYSLEVSTIVNWANPFIIQPYVTPVNPYPWFHPTFVGTSVSESDPIPIFTSGNDITLANSPAHYTTEASVFNIQAGE